MDKERHSSEAILSRGPHFCPWPEPVRICCNHQLLKPGALLGLGVWQETEQKAPLQVFEPAVTRIILNGHIMCLIQGRLQDASNIWQLLIHSAPVVGGPEDLGLLLPLVLFTGHQECVEGETESLPADSVINGAFPTAREVSDGLPG